MGKLQAFAERVRLRLRIGLALTLLGYFTFLLGTNPALFGLDRSPVVGFIQITVLILGLGMICLGGCLSLTWLWNGERLSIAADFGWRLVCTGYVIALWSAMADLWGFGTSSLPRTLCFGPWQARGVLAGQFVIAMGFLMLIPWSKSYPTLPDPSANGSNPSNKEFSA